MGSVTFLGAEKLSFIMRTTISQWIIIINSNNSINIINYSYYLGIGSGWGQCSETLLLCINKQRSVLFCLDSLCIFPVKVDNTFLT